jgi:hypothetical protein
MHLVYDKKTNKNSVLLIFGNLCAILSTLLPDDNVDSREPAHVGQRGWMQQTCPARKAAQGWQNIAPAGGHSPRHCERNDVRNRRGMSGLRMFALSRLGVRRWIVYGLTVGAVPVIVAYATTFLLSMSILIFKLRYQQARGKSCRRPLQ